MIRLVVNADDLGLNALIDKGILRTHQEGIVTSATVLVTGSNAASAVRQALEQGLALGLHLCLSTSLPPAQLPEKVPSLLVNGRFRKSWVHVARDWAMGQIDLKEVEREFEAQFELAKALGFEPDHLDSHQHLHLLPEIRDVVCRLSKRTNLPVRWPDEWRWRAMFQTPARWAKSSLLSTMAALPLGRPWKTLSACGVLESGQMNQFHLSRLLRSLPSGDHELLTHPGYRPSAVPEDAEWLYGWEEEMEALIGQQAKDIVTQRNIRLVSYREIFL